MKCIYCGNTESKVIDSRANEESNSIRRRRECLECGRRFTTYETIESTPIMVIKNGGNRQPFNPAKIKLGLVKACEKRPVPMFKIDALVADIERTINNSLVQEVPSGSIGEMVMERLKTLDDVAYIRFAAVYKQFKDLDSFKNFIDESKK
ncbi:MAG: transcriptional regulator NrdR [Clostridiales bacterium]|jgi:transcriptional repressor NrdR|nr:transcriptional regulator NrdR [Clostridiales bacterium]